MGGIEGDMRVFRDEHGLSAGEIEIAESGFGRSAVSQPMKTSDTRARFRIDPGIAWQVMDDEAVLLDLNRGTVVGLNPAASRIWSMLGDHEEDAIVAALVEEFDVSREIARADVSQFIATCLERSFLVPGTGGEVE